MSGILPSDAEFREGIREIETRIAALEADNARLREALLGAQQALSRHGDPVAETLIAIAKARAALAEPAP